MGDPDRQVGSNILIVCAVFDSVWKANKVWGILGILDIQGTLVVHC